MKYPSGWRDWPGATMLAHAAILRLRDGVGCRVRCWGDDVAREWRTRLISSIVVARADEIIRVFS